MKTCSCGRVFTEIPAQAKFTGPEFEGLSGWWWDCECRSTLFLAIASPLSQELIDREALDRKEAA